jgi:hypothetical protein
VVDSPSAVAVASILSEDILVFALASSAAKLSLRFFFLPSWVRGIVGVDSCAAATTKGILRVRPGGESFWCRLPSSSSAVVCHQSSLDHTRTFDERKRSRCGSRAWTARTLGHFELNSGIENRIISSVCLREHTPGSRRLGSWGRGSSSPFVEQAMCAGWRGEAGRIDAKPHLVPNLQGPGDDGRRRASLATGEPLESRRRRHFRLGDGLLRTQTRTVQDEGALDLCSLEGCRASNCLLRKLALGSIPRLPVALLREEKEGMEHVLQFR